jgi:bifunctional UDP-N-acetylglucosamine pyrophosphorylase/glucosamine-1-phosphate N-acetyltransferase
MSLHIIILAAGMGKRMNSSQPKVLHLLAGKPLLQHVIDTAKSLQPEKIHIIYGHGGEVVKEHLATRSEINWIHQAQQLGTGHAVMQALPHIENNKQVLVLYGDVPLISVNTLQKLFKTTPVNGIGLVNAILTEPTGFGRVVRNSNNNITGIVEEKDANSEQKQIKEIWGGILTSPIQHLKYFLPTLTNNNAQQEYYLPEIINMAVLANLAVNAVIVDHNYEVEGVNDRIQLAQLERCYQSLIAKNLMLAGATLQDPNRFDCRGQIEVAPDVVIDINVIVEGTVMIGKNSTIGPNTHLRNTRIGENVTIQSNSVIDGAMIDDNCKIGPFSHIRPGTHLKNGSKIGNFVEIKNSEIGEQSKVSHLSYIGDTTMGQHVNIGAGTITCNYDGVNKSRTVIGDNAFVGSNTQIIAPVTIGEGATIGAGATITKDAPANRLTINRVKQEVIERWTRPQKKHPETKE